MVKKHPTYTVDPEKPLAKVYLEVGDPQEQVTQLDEGPSLTYMVTTGNVGSMNNNQNKYAYLDNLEDDELHDEPDYSKVKDMDNVEKQQLVEDFLQNEQNYEKKDTSTTVETKVEATEKPTE